MNTHDRKLLIIMAEALNMLMDHLLSDQACYELKRELEHAIYMAKIPGDE